MFGTPFGGIGQQGLPPTAKLVAGGGQQTLALAQNAPWMASFGMKSAAIAFGTLFGGLGQQGATPMGTGFLD
jgi:hypothetical protein